MYKKLIEKIEKGGIEEVKKIISQNEVGENFYLDFKSVTTKSDYKRLSESDKKNLSKALSGFSNTSGGIIIWGVKEEENFFINDFIENPNNFSDLINENIYSLSDPMIINSKSFPVFTADRSKGVVVTIIPESKNSPIQSSYGKSKNRYFIRVGSSHQPANHELVKMLFSKKYDESFQINWGVHKSLLDTKIKDIEGCLKIIPTFFSRGSNLVKEMWIQYTGKNISAKDNFYLDIFEGSQGGMFGGKNLKLKEGETITPLTEINPMYIEIDISSIFEKDMWISITLSALDMKVSKFDKTITKDDMEKFYVNKSDDATIADFVNYFFSDIGTY